jgi:hypothetical protein
MPHSLRVGTKNLSRHAHNSEESLCPFILGDVIPISQWRSATRHVGCKLAKELLSLAPFFSFKYPFITSVCTLIGQKCYDTDGQA